MTTSQSPAILAPGSDTPSRKRRARHRTIRVTTVSIDVDETPSHYLVFVSPRVEAQARGIGYHRSRLPKCGCYRFHGKGNRCRLCRGWNAEGMARYVGRLLRSYPKESVRVPVEQLRSTRVVWPKVTAA